MPRLGASIAMACAVSPGTASISWAADLDWIDITNAPNTTDGRVTINLTDLDADFRASGRTNTAFGAVRLDDTFPTGLALTVGNGLFGTAADVDAAVATQTGWTGVGDGYAAISSAIDTYGGAFRPDTSRVIAFGSAETSFSGNTSNFTRQVIDASVTEASLARKLRDSGVKLFAFVDSPIGGSGDPILAVIRNADSDQYTLARLRGDAVVYETTSDISGLFPEGRTDYTDLALESNGAIMDRSAGTNLTVDAVNPIPGVTDSILENLSVDEVEGAQRELESSGVANNRSTVRRLIGVMNGRAASLLLRGQPIVPFVDREDRDETEEGTIAARAPLTGLAGGDPEGWTVGRLGIWADAAGSLYNAKDRLGKLWGSQYSVMGGADYRITDEALTGLSLGYEHIDVEFDSNRERAVDYVFATLYGAHLLGEVFSIDALMSYGLGFNTTSEAAPLVGDGEHDHLSHRFVGASSLSYNDRLGERVTLFGSGGVSYSHEIIGDYETGAGATVSPEDAALGQLHASGEVGYLLEYGAESRLHPFATARFEYDYLNSAGGDRLGALVGGGLRAQIDDAFSLEAFGNTEVARSDADSTSFGLTARFQF